MADSPCFNCGSSDAVENYTNGAYCFSCHSKQKPGRLKLDSNNLKKSEYKKIKLTALNDYWINWLKEKGITIKTIKQFELQYDELTKSIAYPIKIRNQIIGYQLRDVNKKIRIVKLVNDMPFLFHLKANDEANVVIVEDPVSAMRIWQDTKRNAVALLGTKLSVINRLFLIHSYDHFIVWLDGDLAGYEAAQKIANDLSPYRQTNIIYTRHDPKDFDANNLTRLINMMDRYE